jgi:CheY-like chemotaxis protein
MPDLDGFQVLERLAQEPDLRALPVVVLTAMTLTPDDEARLKQGAQLVLSKAATSPETLLGDLQGLLRGRLSNR